MRIGFDAKRAFMNRSGLGNYSRSLLTMLSEYYPENKYLLYHNLRKSELYEPVFGQRIMPPRHLFSHAFPSAWRSYYIKNDIKLDSLDLYHGLSNELPFGIRKSGVKTAVTIHDLIFKRYPELYKKADRFIYDIKFSHACRVADMVFATSEATKQDIIEFYKIPEAKIKVTYQTCDALYRKRIVDAERSAIRMMYKVSKDFILTVGTIEERKNMLVILKALQIGKLDIELVIVGRATPYLEQLKEYIAQHKMESQVKVLHNVDSYDLPGLYQTAKAFLYPSLYEGFGIPILEALYSGAPVITSTGSCFRETGGDAARYCDPRSPEELAFLIQQVISDSELRNTMISEGKNQAAKFDSDLIIKRIMELYQEIIS
ncbi:MAG: glycosyltransferase family 4 protein [Bacteroidetes bacterium]|nr:glycosyltransferase family 4 protein [Bacteroidota bacterium]